MLVHPCNRTHPCSLCAVAPRLLDLQHRSSGTALAAQHLVHSPSAAWHYSRCTTPPSGSRRAAPATSACASASPPPAQFRRWQRHAAMRARRGTGSQAIHSAVQHSLTLSGATPHAEQLAQGCWASHTSCLITAALPAALTPGGPPGAGWRRSAARRPARRGRTPGCACAWGRGRAAPSRGWGTCRHKAGGCEQVGAEFIQSWEPDKNRTPSWIRKHAAVA